MAAVKFHLLVAINPLSDNRYSSGTDKMLATPGSKRQLCDASIATGSYYRLPNMCTTTQPAGNRDGYYGLQRCRFDGHHAKW